MKRSSVPLSILAALLLAPPSGAADEQAKLPYGTSPTWWTDPMGFYETGLALADINGDRFPDLVVSSGNDQGLQSLAVYLNDGKGNFPKRPSSMSEDLDSNANLAVGDINGDGWLDVAVARSGDQLGAGGVKVYFNHKGTLEKRPSWTSDDRYSAFSCALGDADGDGDLDLAVSVISEGGKLQGTQRIYFNTGGKLERRAQWKSSAPMLGGGILFADVQQDGVLDLVVGSDQIHVYAGSLAANGRSQIPTTPWWSSEKGDPSPWVDVGPLGPKRTWGVVASRNDVLCRMSGSKDCGTKRYQAFVPREGAAEASWKSNARGLGSAVKLADVDGDGVLDLLGGAWGLDSLNGGPLEIYLGQGDAFADAPAFSSELRYRSQIQTLDVADMRQQATCERTWTLTLSRAQAVVTLPDQIVGRIEKVEKNGKALGRREYTSVPGASWISFARRLQAGDQVQVHYTYPGMLDIALANFDCGIGNYVYYSGGRGRCLRPEPASH